MLNNILETPLSKCTGCSACQSACSLGAISMKLNANGFYEPLLSENLCVKCGKCLKACPIGKASSNNRISSYYGCHTDPEVLYQSTSGGAFRALAGKVLEHHGVVYGALYNDDYSEVLFSSSDSEDLTKFQKSKYIVSNPEAIYKSIKEQLDAERFVLFSGAPCQVAGLTCYLNGKYDKLITVDFVCGGMPSLRFWQEHKCFLEKKYKSKIISVDFRSKRHGWGKGYLDIQFSNGKQYFKRDFLDSYYHCFYDEHISVRSSCLTCAFHDNHFSDITIADFWGYGNAGVSDVSKGVSLLVANSQKGDSLIQDTHDFHATLLDNRYSDYALHKSTPTEEELNRNLAFFTLSEKIGFEKAARAICPATVLAHIKQYVKLKLKHR